MIFASIGTTKYQFNRLLKVVDEAMTITNSKEVLIAQVGNSNYQIQYKNARIFKELSFDKMIEYFKLARVVVCHGGPATIFLALKYSRCKPAVIPRLKEFKEHVNDHQKYFVKDLVKRNLVKGNFDNKCLSNSLFIYLKEPELTDKRREIEPSKKLIYRLKLYCDGK